MVPTSLAINKLEQGTENTFRGRDDNATVLQELSEKAMQERATPNVPASLFKLTFSIVIVSFGDIAWNLFTLTICR